MKTLLVPLDGLTLTEQVLPYVRLLAKLPEGRRRTGALEGGSLW